MYMHQSLSIQNTNFKLFKLLKITFSATNSSIYNRNKNNNSDDK